MKPKVFLSHSKKDKEFVEKIANDLRKCGIDVWYDEWEIPPGDSIRKKIFEDGIVSCDLFFIYLTEHSIPSYWVEKELDGALIHEIETNNSFVALFVNNEESRNRLSIDLKASNIPEFNNDEYLIPLGKLMSKIWSSHMKIRLKEREKDFKIEILELKNNNSELQNKIIQIEKNSKIDIESIDQFLISNKFEHYGVQITLKDILIASKNHLANGANQYVIMRIVTTLLNVDTDSWAGDDKEIDFEKNFKIWDFTGELILHGLLEVKTSKELDQNYYLTQQGIEYLNTITVANIG